jgi:hypothetical protein
MLVRCRAGLQARDKRRHGNIYSCARLKKSALKVRMGRSKSPSWMAHAGRHPSFRKVKVALSSLGRTILLRRGSNRAEPGGGSVLGPLCSDAGPGDEGEAVPRERLPKSIAILR